MAEAAAGVRDHASGTAADAEASAGQLTAVAAAIEEMTTSVAEISRQVAAASQVAREAVGRADASQVTMKGLAEATSRIGDVVGLISEIAGQTNLLALNATIEAARAGEAGRGFAVVAGEVKALAAQTANATREIGGQIEAVRAATSGSISAMADVVGIIGRLDEVTTIIAAAVEEQSATTRDIAGNLQVVASSGNQTAAAMKQVVEVSGEAGAVSQQVLEAAGSIGSEAERLRAEVDQFLAAVCDDTGNRRRYERIPGNGAKAVLTANGHAPRQVAVQDLSRGGVAILCDWKLQAGAEVTIELPGAPGTISGRAVRSAGNVLALVFRQDTQTLARLDRSLALFAASQQAA
jgi:methyl-accepting chemotaxis protein